MVPGTSFQVDFLEVHGLDRRHITSRPRDPGSAILRLRVSDIDKAIQALAAQNVVVVSTDGAPVTVVGAAQTQRYAIARTPDGYFIQVVEQRPNPNAPAAAPAPAAPKPPVTP